jgi:hypothetical protein
MHFLFVIQDVSDADGCAISKLQFWSSEPQINAQPTASETNANTAIGAAAAYADACAHGGLYGFAIGTTPGQGRCDRNQ